uniref:Uncharacterized protein n=1 Tax=Leersia perrieri TaxID=77586 RepID=A0A0D9WFX3_9ORYZ
MGEKDVGAINVAASGITTSLPAAMSSMVDNLLRGFHLLSPRLVIFTDNEANHFSTSSLEESSVLCHPAERKSLEKYVLKEEIKDIITSEDMSWWIVRVGAAGFVFCPTSIILVAAQPPGRGIRYGVTKGSGWLILNRMDKAIKISPLEHPFTYATMTAHIGGD